MRRHHIVAVVLASSLLCCSGDDAPTQTETCETLADGWCRMRRNACADFSSQCADDFLLVCLSDTQAVHPAPTWGALDACAEQVAQQGCSLAIDVTDECSWLGE